MSDQQSSMSRGRQQRSRLRGVLTGKRGRQVGLASLMAPLAGYVIRDLRKPDSVIRVLTQRTSAWLTATIASHRKRIDYAEPVEIVDATIDDTDPHESLLQKEDSDAERR